jgi:hypothetical protein
MINLKKSSLKKCPLLFPLSAAAGYYAQRNSFFCIWSLLHISDRTHYSLSVGKTIKFTFKVDETETKMEMDEDVKSQVEEEICSNCQVVKKPTLKNDQLSTSNIGSYFN